MSDEYDTMMTARSAKRNRRIMRVLRRPLERSVGQMTIGPRMIRFESHGGAGGGRGKSNPAQQRAKKGSSLPFEAVDTSSKTAAAITAKKSTRVAAATPVQEVMAYFRSLEGAPGSTARETSKEPH